MTFKTLPCGKKIRIHKSVSETEVLKLKSKLEKYLISKKLKITGPRWKIAKIIIEAGGHFDTSEISKLVKIKFPKIGAATVYRSLKLLTEAGILSPLQAPSEGGQTKYEIARPEHHDHLLCKNCGQLFEFHNQTIEELQNKIAKSLGFALNDHRHLILGECQFVSRSC